MESQFKANIDGTQVMGSRSDDVKVANRRSIRSSDFLLRIVVLVTTLVAAIVMGVAKETRVIPVALGPIVTPMFVAVPAKSHYSSALVFFTVANAIACAYATISLVILIANRTATIGLSLYLTILDLMVMALLFSGNGAASAVGILADKGNSHVGWNKICNVYGKFCHQTTASVIISLIGSVFFLLLIILSIFNLHRRSR
ncbi:CASP-like protein 1E2 [Tasmannia lanceolata]|uniref:CASP-like protein 1E2 n=1 Tax=Tasmannia lanceolata TaxID=3420 RepID=UPI004064AA0C